MVGIFSFLLVLSIVALVVAVVRLVLSAVKKKPKKPSAIMAAVSVAIFLISFVGIGVTYNPTPEQIAERERVAAEKAAAKEERERQKAEEKAEQERLATEKAEQERLEVEEAARREAEEAARAEAQQQESPAVASPESQTPEPSASVPASAPSETTEKPETSTPAESQKPVQSETPAKPSAESELSSSPTQDFVLDFSSLTTSDIGKLDTGNLELKFGELLDVTYGGDVYGGNGVIVVKAKITPNLTNKMTIQQNYHSICELITDHGFDSCRELQYWAVADMADGSEGKVISFTLDSDTILGVANQTILPINLDGYLQDLWILPSLLG